MTQYFRRLFQSAILVGLTGALIALSYTNPMCKSANQTDLTLNTATAAGVTEFEGIEIEDEPVSLSSLNPSIVGNYLDDQYLEANSDGHEEEIETTEYSKTMYVTAFTLYVRSEMDASTDDTIIDVFGQGHEVIVTAEYEDCNWVQIDYNGEQAYLAGKYLSENAHDIIEYSTSSVSSSFDGTVLDKYLGRVSGPSGTETYYNLDMSYCVERMNSLGYVGSYWVREDGCKMFGNYIMVAANFETRPLGTILETSLGTSIVVDTGDFVSTNPNGIDVATNW